MTKMKWMKWLAVGMDVVLGLYIVAVLALIFFLPTFHDCTCCGGPTPLERFGNAVEDAASVMTLVTPFWGLVRAYYCLRTCSLRRWWRILAGLVLWPAALLVLYFLGYNIYDCIKEYYNPLHLDYCSTPGIAKEPPFGWSIFLFNAGSLIATGLAIVIGEKMGLFRRHAAASQEKP